MIGSVLLFYLLRLEQVLALALALGNAVGLCLFLGDFIVTGVGPIVLRLEAISFGVVAGFPLQILAFKVKPDYA